MSDAPLDLLVASLGMPFADANLLALALTHRSYLNEHPEVGEDNERLEFLGDAVLDFLVGNYLYSRFPAMREGEMTALRAALVRAETLAAFARDLTVDAHLRLGYGESETGGRAKVATLSAAFEAVIGALYLDQGMTAVTALVERLIEPMLAKIQAEALHKDAKSEFQVWAQATHGLTPHYRVVSAQGPDHAKQFAVQVLVGEQVWGEGVGLSKQRAAQMAALAALNRAATIGEPTAAG